MDRRSEASRANAVARLLIEKNRLREAIADEEEGVEMCRAFSLPKFQLEAAERRLALLRVELAELQPGRRPPTPTTEPKEPTDA